MTAKPSYPIAVLSGLIDDDDDEPGDDDDGSGPKRKDATHRTVEVMRR